MKITVVQSGGFAGMVQKGELDTTAVPDGSEIESFAGRVDVAALRGTKTQPDRFVYDVALGDDRLRIGEQDLTDDLRWVVKRVMSGGAEPVRPGSQPGSEENDDGDEDSVRDLTASEAPESRGDKSGLAG